MSRSGSNEKLCRKLFKEGEYFDWVVTTAFYSAIHYVENSVLPYKYDGILLRDIHHAKRHLSKICKAKLPLHDVRSMLLEHKYPGEIASYSHLWSASSNARYTNYNITREEASLAIEMLDDVKALLDF